MRFQLLNILVYGTNGQIRSLEFKPDAVNIITGQSRTGKSALIHIVDYCLGRRECNIPIGMISKHATWYAVKLQISSGEIFLARRNSAQDNKSSEDIYIERGTSLSFPIARNLRKNSNLETIRSILNQVLGIREYTCEPEAGQTRKTGTANIEKALSYCFQEQGEIDNKDFLFHRQGDSFVAQSIKDYLPYFLGAITEDFIKNKESLRELKRTLRQIEARNAEVDRIRGKNFERAFSLLNEAKAVGLITTDESFQNSWGKVRRLIETALSRNIDNDFMESDVEILTCLLDKQRQIRESYRQVTAELNSLKELKQASNGFSSEMEEQKSRLESINIFKHTEISNICPLCSSVLPNTIPSEKAILASLIDIENQLKTVTNDTPQLNILIKNDEDRLIDIKKQLRKVNASIISLQATNKRISELRDFNSQQALVKGRLSLYLETMPEKDTEVPENKLEIEQLYQQVSILNEKVNNEVVFDRLQSITSLISSQLTTLAKKLKIEHSKFPMRLDLKKLTVIADSDDGPIPMPKMGSGETWVSLHLVTHLVLHQWFLKHNRPVPQFLFLDQPSQAYFPPDTSAETICTQINKTDSDRESVIRMFKMIIQETHGFQVIITEHANITEPWYQTLVRETWWDGKKKLIPVEWTGNSL